VTHSHFRQVLDDYARLEPGESDTWNPLHDDVELLHRVELFKLLTWALRESGADVNELSVLDVGCGNGRSTRMYLDLGLSPAQLTGIDLRPGALARARAAHAGIRFDRYDGDAFPTAEASVDWVSLCTVLSSVRAPQGRRHIAGEIHRVLRPGGHFFFWDLLRANDYAGCDALIAEDLFPEFKLVWDATTIIDGFRERDFGRDQSKMQRGNPTHRAVLLTRERRAL